MPMATVQWLAQRLLLPSKNRKGLIQKYLKIYEKNELSIAMYDIEIPMIRNK